VGTGLEAVVKRKFPSLSDFQAGSLNKNETPVSCYNLERGQKPFTSTSMT